MDAEEFAVGALRISGGNLIYGSMVSFGGGTCAALRGQVRALNGIRLENTQTEVCVTRFDGILLEYPAWPDAKLPDGHGDKSWAKKLSVIGQ